MSPPFPRAPRSYPEVVAGGLRIACISRAGLAGLMVEECIQARASGRVAPKVVNSVNGQAISLAARDAEFRRCLEMADHLHADGQPLVIAARLLASPRIPERSAVTDFFHDAAAAAHDAGLRFFLLGGLEADNAACAAIMERRYPGLIAGRRHGYFDLEDEETICAEINAAGADAVWVGLGMPLEQAFCARNRHRIQAGWILVAGGCFNYVSGRYRRAPVWMQLAGLEWLYRFWREPGRLFLRYAITNPHAFYLLLTRTFSVHPSPKHVGRGRAQARELAG